MLSHSAGNGKGEHGDNDGEEHAPRATQTPTAMAEPRFVMLRQNTTILFSRRIKSTPTPNRIGTTQT